MRHEMSLKPDLANTRKFLVAMRMSKRALPTHIPPLLYLTDPERSDDPVRVAESLPAGSGIIYRHFGLSNRRHVASHLRQATYKNRIKLLISNDPELACDVRADGVHWPEAQLAKAKYWRDRFHLMTASAHSRSALAKPSMSLIDAALVSTVFASGSKTASPPMGALKFRQLTQQLRYIPIYALGGVHAHNASAIAAHGGLASISGIQKRFGAKT